MPLVRRIAKNTVYLLSSNVVSGIISFILLFVIAKELGSVEFGKFSFAKALPQIFIVLVNMGIELAAIREVARNKQLTSKFLSHGFILKLCFSFLTLAIVYISLLVMKKPQDVVSATMTFTSFLIITSFLSFYYSFFKAHEEMGYPTFFLLLDKLILLSVVGLLAFYNLLNLKSTVRTFMGIEFFIFLIVSLVILYKYGVLNFRIDPGFLKHILAISWPFALSSVFSLLTINADQIMLSLMKDDKTVGCYSLGYTLICYSGFIPSSFMGAVYPVMSRFSITSRSDLVKTYIKSFKYMLMAGPPITAGFYILAPKIIGLAGSEYLPAVSALRIMSWSWLFSSVGIVMCNLANAINKERLTTVFIIICTLTNIGLNLILIPRFSLYGASYVTLITNILYCLLFYFFVARYFSRHRQFFIVGIKSALAALAMASILYSFPSLNLFILIFIGAITYLSIVLILKTFDPEDWGLVRKIFK